MAPSGHSITDRTIRRTKNWFKRLIPRSPSTSLHPPDEKKPLGTGAFSNAQGTTVTGGQFVDASNAHDMTINYISRGEPVFKLLEPCACLDARKDSSARHPPPRCHPETRSKIRERLMRWLVHEYDEWKMLWVRGSAGTGKSAVAQSFGDSCEEENLHGASYFFSRPTGRNKVETVVPTIVYQLATTIPEYRSLVGDQLANDPSLLRNSPPVQFRRLLVEPFAMLHRRHSRKPIVIILDGLDECEGEDAQWEILEMITNAIRTNPDLPLRWLIFSRPEAHLKNAFSRNFECGREELVIDDECRENVERYVRDGLNEVKAKYRDIIPPDWPPPDKLQELLDTVSGLFVFASTCLNFIGDRGEADPRSQLDSLLKFIRRSEGIMSRNPLAALDLLYSRILDDISPSVFQTTRKILGYMSHQGRIDEDRGLGSAQTLSNFLRLDQHTFYKTVRGLHSVMYIPESEDAALSELRFHHTSFLDFLVDPHRSGKLAIGEQEAIKEIIRSGVYWYEVDVANFHTGDGWDFDLKHEHDSLPGLTWASEDNRLPLSQSITTFINGLFDRHFGVRLESADEDLLSQISSCDFRYWNAEDLINLAVLSRLDPSNSVVHVEPSSPTDHQLLEYFNLVIGNGFARQAMFPLRKYYPEDRFIREYFFIGHGVQSVIIWRTESFFDRYMCSLRCDQEPSKAQISKYQESLRELRWDEAQANSQLE